MARFASCAVAGLMLFAPSALRAQVAGVGDQFDPPDTEYSTGAIEMDAADVATFPTAPQFRAFLPVSVDLSFRMPAVRSQGKANSCVAWATAYAARSYYTAALENRDVELSENLPSPNFVYALARQISKYEACHKGSSFKSTLAVLKKGALSLAQYPYSDADCDTAPPPQVVATANDFRVRDAHVINVARLDDVKGALARSNPVYIEFNYDNAFDKHRGEGVFTNAVAVPKADSWHAMTLVGYDERMQAFRLINSWGSGWGDHGYAWISYEVFSKRVRFAATLDVAASRPKIANLRPQPPAPAPAPRPAPAPAPRVDITPPPAPYPSPQPFRRPPPAPNVSPPAPNPPPVTDVNPPGPGPRPFRRPLPPPIVDVSPPAPVPVPQPGPSPGPLPSPEVMPGLAALDSLSCAKVIVQRRGQQDVLEGFVGSAADLAFVNRIVATVPNTVVGNVEVAPWPQCEVLQTLERPLAAADAAQIDTGPSAFARAGDTLRIAVQPPSQITFLYVSYVQADGSVIHLVQPTGLVPQPTLPGETLIFGDGAQGRDRFTVNAPFGREMIIAVSSRSPLFDARLPLQQTEREYLTALRRALAYKVDASMPDREVSASVKTIVTRSR